MTEDTEMVLNDIPTRMSTRATLKEVKLTVMVCTTGKMVRLMMESGSMVKKQAKVHGKVINFSSHYLDPFGEYYTGEWKDNKANGKGEHVWSTGDRYEGDWLNFLKHGYGTDFFANGDKYIGKYRYGKPWGFGKYYWLSGAEYEGDFEDGKKNGKGIWKKK